MKGHNQLDRSRLRLTTNRIADVPASTSRRSTNTFPERKRLSPSCAAGMAPTSARRSARCSRSTRRGTSNRTIRALVSVGIAGHAHAPRLHQIFTEEMPALGYRDVAAIDAPIFEAMRRFLRAPDVDVRDTDLTLWVIATASGAVLHRAAIERPEDLSSGVIAEELITLLCRYLRRPVGPRRRTSRGAQPHRLGLRK